MSMAHGLESRVPFLDHKLVELAATIPADIKFKNGELKRLLVRAFDPVLPKSITSRKDKMGFPVPLNEWMKSELKDFVCGIFETGRDIGRTFFIQMLFWIIYLKKENLVVKYGVCCL